MGGVKVVIIYPLLSFVKSPYIEYDKPHGLFVILKGGYNIITFITLFYVIFFMLFIIYVML